jgi:hypothetical protein
MKTNSIKSFRTLFVFLFALALTIPTQAEEISLAPPKWEKLGQRKVNRAVDKDEIFVTAREGRFSKVKLVVKKSAINMHKMVIHYANGGKQDINLRNNIPAGGSTRVIDINGGKRIIKKVVFWYDTKGLINNKAVVELWGRH